ncbi:MAG: DUF1573 domain-containing protein [Planctomycetes bacterium]|nr:DUF1573 domain-containing protein [Planctomycetota bacterium]
MKKFSKALLIIGLASIFVTAAGCQEKEQVNTPDNNGFTADPPVASNDTAAPKVSPNTPRIIKISGEVKPDQGEKSSIKFEKLSHDFGLMGPKASSSFEFKFKNTGKGTLIFTRQPLSTCGCTVAILKKMKYAPGESGSVKLTFTSNSNPAKVMKHITVFTNDPKNPRVSLGIKAEVQIPIKTTPNPLNLKLNKDNAGAVPITITTTDGKPFAIKSFSSTSSVISADFDKTKKAIKHTINPKVDLTKLRKTLNGNIAINIDHPVIKQVLLFFTAPPIVRLSSSRITLLDLIPGKPITREIMVLSNYGEKIEIESIISAKKCMKVIDQKEMGNSVKLVVEVTPHKKTKHGNYFYDHMTINIKGGEKLTLISSGFYKATKPKKTVKISN